MDLRDCGGTFSDTSPTCPFRRESVVGGESRQSSLFLLRPLRLAHVARWCDVAMATSRFPAGALSAHPSQKGKKTLAKNKSLSSMLLVFFKGQSVMWVAIEMVRKLPKRDAQCNPIASVVCTKVCVTAVSMADRYRSYIFFLKQVRSHYVQTYCDFTFFKE